jgi:hypothetical protein
MEVINNHSPLSLADNHSGLHRLADHPDPWSNLKESQKKKIVQSSFAKKVKCVKLDKVTHGA